MFPTTRANIAEVTSILSTLTRGSGTGTDSSGTTGSTSSLPFYPNMPSDLVDRVITTYLDGTNTISTSGLGATSVNYLANIRSRVNDSINSIYADTPNISPYYYSNGTIKSSTLRDGARDLLIQGLFQHDARYFLRKRASTAIGGMNEFYEFPTRHNYINTPLIQANMFDHVIPAGTVDDTGVGGTYRIVTTNPHGTYDVTEAGEGVMSFYRSGFSGNSILNKGYYVDDLYQEVSITFDGTDTNSKFRFNANIGTNYLIDGTTASGSRILTLDAGTDWLPVEWQPPERYFKIVDGGTAYQYYHDRALTEQMIPGYGYIKDVHIGFHNGVDASGATGGVAVQTSNQYGNILYTHLMFEDIPQVFDRPTGWTGNLGIYDRQTVTTYESRPSAGSYFSGSGNLSIYDAQPLNFVSTTAGFTTLSNDPTMLYAKHLGSGNIQAYTNVGLSTIYNVGEEIGTVSNIAYVSGNVELTFNVTYPGLANGVGVRITNSNIGFSRAYNVDSVAANNVCSLDQVHFFEQGQPIYNLNNPDQTYYAQVTGFANNQVRLHTGVSWSGGVPTFSGNTAPAVNDSLRAAWYVGRVNDTTWRLFNDQGRTTPYTTVLSLTNFQTCDTRPIRFTLSLSNSYLQPMFYCRMEGYNSASLWRDIGRTLPYAYYAAGANFGTPGTYSAVQGTTAGTYRVNSQAMEAGFTSNAKPMGWFISQAFYTKVIDDFTLDMYADPARTVKVTSPAIASAQTTTGLLATYLFVGRYKIGSFTTINPGGTTYLYDNNGDGIPDTVGVGWNTTGEYFYTPHYNVQNMIYHAPTIAVEAFTDSANAGAYYGHLRPTTSNVSLQSATGPVYKDPGEWGGLDNTSPLAVYKRDPGMFEYSTPIIIGIERFPDVVITETDPDLIPLANTNPQWDTVNNMLDRAEREWPTTTNPSSVTWTIEQPNQILETLNSTRFTKAADITQYRIRYVYPPLTAEQIRPYVDVIHAARGSYKPFRLRVPTGTGGNEQAGDGLTIRYWDRASAASVPTILRVRETLNGGSKILKIDGAPINFNQTSGNVSLGTTYVFGTGHPVAARHEYLQDEAGYNSSLGGWMLPIHDVESNGYGEINIRLNNGIPGLMDLGTRIFRDAAPLNVFLDGNSVELKVDVLGYHYLEVEFITKKIF